MNKLFTLKPVLLFALVALLLASCAPGNLKFNEAPANFWFGLWHGFIALFSFIFSLFNDNVTMYEANNVGKLYNLGFLIGVMIFWGGGSKGTCSWKK